MVRYLGGVGAVGRDLAPEKDPTEARLHEGLAYATAQRPRHANVHSAGPRHLLALAKVSSTAAYDCSANDNADALCTGHAYMKGTADEVQFLSGMI
jgi:hypothetical protein